MEDSERQKQSEQYRRISFQVAGQAGFAVPRLPGIPLPSSGKLSLVENATVRASLALEALTPLLHDEDQVVRRAARAGTQRALRVGLIADFESRPSPPSPVFQFIDRNVSRLVPHSIDPDRPESGLPTLDDFRRARTIVMAAVIAGWLAVAVCITTHRYLLGLAALIAAVGFDFLEGSVGRIGHSASEVDRWKACLISHFLELGIVAAVALDEYQAKEVLATAVLLLAGAVAIYGSLVRISALQVGYRFERSISERAVRLIGSAAFLVFAQVHLPDNLPSVAVIATFGGFGAFEAIHVWIKVKRRRAYEGAFVFYFGDHGEEDADSWGFSDASTSRPHDSVAAGTRKSG